MSCETIEVGKVYSEAGYRDATVIHIGRESVFYSFVCNNSVIEDAYNIVNFKKNKTLVKPKREKIELIPCLNNIGNIEYITSDCQYPVFSKCSLRNEDNGSFKRRIKSLPSIWIYKDDFSFCEEE